MRTRSIVLLSLALFVAACSSDSSTDSTSEAQAASASGVVIETLSTRPEYVTGGDVVVRVSAESGDPITLTVNGTDVTSSLEAGDEGMTGLVTGLRDGPNQLEARSGDAVATLEVVNHPTTGPLFSGPHLEPYVCTTEAFGLGPATDEDCSAPTKTTWSYVNAAREIVPIEDPAAPLPADVATVTVDEQQIPFVVRTEQGVLNRGIYWISVLDPTPGEAWDDRGWNERLVFRFGGGCGTSYSQGVNFTGEGRDLDLLERGYAVTTGTLATFQSNCNDVLTAETALVTKEHFSERYGVPELTIGDGGSGGAIQQLMVAQNYPGILDALSPSLPFPDAVTIAGGVTDCGLLSTWFESPAAAGWTDEQKAAVTGNLTAATCDMWRRTFVSAVDPKVGCNPALADVVYEPTTRPDGVRCTLQDVNVNVFGIDPATGFARRPLSNVGVQYGLEAFQQGVIDAEQFVTLNETIGSYDIDGNLVSTRTPADLEAVEISFRTGRALEGGPLLDIPIILRDVYTDDLGDIHTRFHAFTIRERLRRDGVDAPNLLLWTQPAGGVGLTDALLGNAGAGNLPIYVLDEWLTTGTKPAEAVQRCLLPDGTEVTGGWEIYDEPGPCRDAFPVYGDPRTAAGAPQRNDVIACQLRPIDPADYPAPLTPEQLARLEVVFPDGVCDWTEPSQGMQPLGEPWQSFGT